MSRNSSTALECPICKAKIPSLIMNDHIDQCLGVDARNEASKSSGAATKRSSSSASLPVTSTKKVKQSTSCSSPIDLDASVDERTSSKESARVQNGASTTPLAERMRPTTLDTYVGQRNLSLASSRGSSAATTAPLERMLSARRSLILWGPPGCGKTTLARILSKHWARDGATRFVQISAVGTGVAELRKILEEARGRIRLKQGCTTLFCDEIHHWSKSQQDSLLGAVEDGSVVLIGATTENPSFQLNAAVLSRATVYRLEKHEAADVRTMLKRAVTERRGLPNTNVDEEAIDAICVYADGDMRVALNTLERAHSVAASDGATGNANVLVDAAAVRAAIGDVTSAYGVDEHYDLISALHKSMRGSNVDASLYYMWRMISAGDKPLYVARRLVRFASEDIGVADPRALQVAVAAYQACHLIGMPECDVCLAQAVVYLAQAPKSVQLYEAMKAVQEAVRREPNAPVPAHLKNAPTQLMKNLGFGKDYVYNPHATAEEAVAQTYLPDSVLKRLGNASFF